jgi:hypothetical protein
MELKGFLRFPLLNHVHQSDHIRMSIQIHHRSHFRVGVGVRKAERKVPKSQLWRSTTAHSHPLYDFFIRLAAKQLPKLSVTFHTSENVPSPIFSMNLYRSKLSGSLNRVSPDDKLLATEPSISFYERGKRVRKIKMTPENYMTAQTSVKWCHHSRLCTFWCFFLAQWFSCIFGTKQREAFFCYLGH